MIYLNGRFRPFIFFREFDMDKRKERLADLALLTMAFIWGSGFIVTKNSLDTLSSMQLLFLRFLIAAVVLFAVNLLKIKDINKTTVKKGALIGTMLFLGYVFQTYGLEGTLVSKSAFLTAVYVAIVPFFSMFIAKDRPDVYNFTAAFLTLIGVFFLSYNGKEPLGISVYDLLVLIGSLFWAAHVFLVGHLGNNEDSAVLCMLQMFFAGLLSLLFLIYTGEINTIQLDSTTAYEVLYLGVVSSAVAFLLQNTAQKYTSPTHAGILMSMESVFSTILGIIFLGEIFTFRMFVGCSIIFIALVMAETGFSFLRRGEGRKEMIEDKVRAVVGKENFLLDESMKEHCTFRCGGNAKYYVTPETEEQLIEVIKILTEAEEKFIVTGRGSNLLVRDEGIDGYVVNTNLLNDIKVEGDLITAQTGASLVKVSNTAADSSLSGLEFACAIPGSIGGAVFMNAGAHGGEMKDVLADVRVFDGKDIVTLTAEELDLSYRHSNVEKKGYTVLSARLQLEKGDEAQIREKIAANREFRKKQPSEPSAGSTFKRGDGFITAKLIDDAGLKGAAVGGAKVSEKHAGFIVNSNGASSEDVLKLIDYVKKEVYNKYRVNIEEEIRII